MRDFRYLVAIHLQVWRRNTLKDLPDLVFASAGIHDVHCRVWGEMLRWHQKAALGQTEGQSANPKHSLEEHA